MSDFLRFRQLLDEVLAPYAGRVIERLRDIQGRPYDHSLSHISFELRAGFPGEFPIMVYYMDAENCQVDAVGAPGGFEYLLEDFSLPDIETVQVKVEQLLPDTREAADIEALAWERWLYERWQEAGFGTNAPPAYAEGYYSGVRIDLHTGEEGNAWDK
ncbi:hypothetical protein RBA41_30400 [Massilia sp. CCM 9210]|uniref:hypothetical protein n=1 Tax=Massilia scottii TaxID=3057166 RepID=UPI00279699B0|nr:hypothetical protein [Massilia sp. CCM 9210]MDQ1817626.1 hypothetical protein [Massilia sp. CCM 9210]